MKRKESQVEALRSDFQHLILIMFTVMDQMIQNILKSANWVSNCEKNESKTPATDQRD